MLGIAAAMVTPECTQEGKREFPGVFSLLSNCWGGGLFSLGHCTSMKPKENSENNE